MKRTIYISLFILLYLIVAFSSFWHAIEFFSLTNIGWMSIILAFAFELGQAAVLFSILTSSDNKFSTWSLMTMLTLVQIIGNVFSSYKYLMLNNVADLQYFKEPIFVWTDLPDNITTVLVTYISSAILPITALLLTSMIASYLQGNKKTILDDNNTDHEDNDESNDSNIEKNDIVEETTDDMKYDDNETTESSNVKSHFINL